MGFEMEELMAAVKMESSCVENKQSATTSSSMSEGSYGFAVSPVVSSSPAHR